MISHTNLAPTNALVPIAPTVLALTSFTLSTRFISLIDLANLAAFAAFADLPDLNDVFDSIAITSSSHKTAFIIHNWRQHPAQIACRRLVNALGDVSITIIVRSTDYPITQDRILQTFTLATALANPTLRNNFGSMNIACIHCKALHWSVERVNSLTSRNFSTFVFEFYCKKGAV